MWHHCLLSIAFLLWHSAVGATSGEEALAQPQSGDKRCLIQLNAARRPVGSTADEERQADETSTELQRVNKPEASLSPRWPNPSLDFGEPTYSPVFRPAVDKKANGKVPRSLTSEADRDALIRVGPNIVPQTLAVDDQRYSSLRPEVAEETPTWTAGSRHHRSSPKQADKEVSFDPVPTPMSEAGVRKLISQSTNEDEETFLNYVPRLDDPMLVSGSASFGSLSMQPGEEAGFEELGGLARTSKDVFASWDPSAAARLVSANDKVPGRSSVQMDEQERFFNPVPSPIAPMLPEDAKAIFGREASLLSNIAHSPILTADDFRALEAPLLSKTAHSQILTADDFRSLGEEALPAKDPSLFANTMFMEEPQKRDRHIYHPKVAIPLLQEPIEPHGSELLGSKHAETNGVDRLWKTPLQLQTDTAASLLERLWGHVSGAVQRTHSKVINLVYMVPVPGLFLLVAAALTSGVAFLTVGRINHQAEAANPRSLNKDFGSLFVRRRGTPAALHSSPAIALRAPQLLPQHGEDPPSFGPEDLDPSSPFAEALAHSELPPVQQSRSGRHATGSSPINSDNTLTKFRRNLLRGVPKKDIFWKSFGKSPTSSYEGTPHGQALTAGHYLCPGLVVPPDCECIFAVPSIKDTASQKYVVFDLAGQPALQLEVRIPDWLGSSGLDPKPVVVLHTCEKMEEDGKVIASKALAYCKMEHYADSQNDQDHQQDRAYIYDAGGVLFGTLSAWAVQNHCYTLTSTRSSIQLSLEGDFDEHMVNIWSESRHIVGDSSPSCNSSLDHAKNYWRLRVLANMDAGLLLTSLVCAELIEGKNRHRRSWPEIRQSDKKHAYEMQ